MSEDTKEQIQAVLELLRHTLMNNRVSIAVSVDDEDSKLIFFDTETYMSEKRFSGFEMSTIDLVR